MTKKLESITTFVPFGYGMIGMTKANDPSTVNDPIIVFVHNRAVAGKFIDGEPVLTKREENTMNKEVRTLIDMLNTSFSHRMDFVNVGDAYNQPRGPRKRRINPETNAKAQPDTIEKPKQRGGRRKAEKAPGLTGFEMLTQPVAVKRGGRRKKAETPAAPAELVTAETVKKERAMASAHEAPPEQPKMQRRARTKNEKMAIPDPHTGRTVRRRKVEGKTREVAVEVRRSRKRANTPANVPEHA